MPEEGDPTSGWQRRRRRGEGEGRQGGITEGSPRQKVGTEAAMNKNQLYVRLFVALCLPTTGMVLGVIYTYSINRLSDALYLFIFPIVITTLIVFTGNLFIHIPFFKKVVILGAIPAAIIYDVSVERIVFSYLPIPGTALEYYGYGAIILFCIFLPITVISVIGISFCSWLAYRINVLLYNQKLADGTK